MTHDQFLRFWLSITIREVYLDQFKQGSKQVFLQKKIFYFIVFSSFVFRSLVYYFLPLSQFLIYICGLLCSIDYLT